MKNNKIPEFYMNFVQTVPEFYIIIARKNFSLIFFFWGGARAPAPRLLRLGVPIKLLFSLFSRKVKVRYS